MEEGNPNADLIQNDSNINQPTNNIDNSVPSQPPQKKKIILIIAGIIIFLLVAGFGGYYIWKYVIKSVNTVSNIQVEKPSNVSFEEYTDNEYGAMFQKPVGWQVSLSNGVVYIKEGSTDQTEVFFSFIKNVTDKINAVGLADTIMKKNKETYPDFVFIAKISENKGIVELDANFTNKQGKKSKGVYLVTVQNGNGFYGGYQTLAENFDKKQETLKYVLSSIQLLPEKQSATTYVDPNLSVNLVSKSLSDGSASIQVPEDWSVQGAAAALVASNPESNSGYIGQTVSIVAPAYSAYAGKNPVSDYKGPADFIKDVYIPALGGTDINVVSEKDAPNAIEGASGVESKVVVVTYTGPKGTKAKGSFLAITMAPSQITGNWNALVYAVWAPEDQFDSRFTLLIRIAQTYAPNEQYIAQVMQQNIANANRIAQRTSQILSESYDITTSIGEVKNEAFDKNYQGWNDYYAGEERMYSSSENKVYTLPAGYDTYNNPNYSSEQLSPISGDQWKMEADRSYLPGGWHY